jgi:hypothetical protein
MSSQALRRLFLFSVAGILVFPAFSMAQTKLSHVRVVRLSFVSGTVALKRPASTEWAKALVNTPLQEGFEIKTSANSYAEVEFENGSTARLGEQSQISFEQLAIDADGNKLNRLAFDQGYASFHFLPEHHDAYTVKMAETLLTSSGKTEFRTDLSPGRARVEVFSGAVEVAEASQTVKLGKNKVLEFDPGATQVAMNTTQGIVKDSWDNWTSRRDTQAQLAMNDQAVSSRGPAYGWSDLDSYGEWGFFPGFGYGWSPFAAAGWSPYTMGMWSFYPGMGYTWISGEPWGWMPYHYGNWNFASGFGWFWMPGGSAAFSPGLVNWYSGPGWIGWSPIGKPGLGGQNVVTTVASGTLQAGLPVTPQNVNFVSATSGSRIEGIPIEPGAGAMLPGERLSANAETSIAPSASMTHSNAPSSILMGGDPEKESWVEGKHSFNEPLRARMGTTLGGQYRVGGAVGEFHGDAFAGSHGPVGMNGPQGVQFYRGPGAGGPTILPHAQQASNSSSPQTGDSGINSGGAVGNSASGPSNSMGPATGGPSGGVHGGGSSSGGHH